MKKLLIVIPSYRWGGDSTALFNLLRNLDISRYKIDLFPLLEEGPYKERYVNCTLLKGNVSIEALLRPFQPSADGRSILAYLLKVLNRLSRGRFINTVFRHVGRKLIRQSSYDAVIAWTEWEPTMFVSLIPHNYRMAWIHCDYAYNNHSKMDDEAYGRLDKIITVSHFCKRRFLELFPDLDDKVEVLYDVLDVRAIKEKSGEPISDYPRGKGFNLLSVGRIAPGKRFSAIPEIASRLKDAGLVFHWSIIGPNQHPDELERIEESKVKFGVEDCVEYLGVRVNPFPYIRQADLVISTSASESLSYAILEALILGTPTINADFQVAYEVLDNGKNGLIVPLEEMAAMIIRYLKDSRLQQTIKEGVEEYRYDDSLILAGFDRLFP